MTVSVTAKALGNTKAVCKSSYIHPGILHFGEYDSLREFASSLPWKSRGELKLDEARFLAALPHLNVITGGASPMIHV
ncbi:hypothetical protein U8335_14195 [Roseiconus lacunae]|uniref:hypothetical protein n=1 Tax=Roseiconus lacunae TaxID=2605694 RepID=UPI00308E7D7F|nr:hypothetical protein U8335_14195 [Stieleria sp. HD01]